MNQTPHKLSQDLDLPSKGYIYEEKIPMPIGKRVITRDFLRSIERRPFVSPKDPPNEKRFDPPEDSLNNRFKIKL